MTTDTEQEEQIPPPEGNPVREPKKQKFEKGLPKHQRGKIDPNDQRPQVPVHGGSAKFNSYRLPASIDISSQLLPPITKNKIATYEVLAFAKHDILIKEGGNEISPAPVILPGRYSFYDPFEPDLAKRNRIIQNVTGKERKDVPNQFNGQVESHMVDRVEEIIMENGFLTVNQETEYMKYLFMELSPWNQTNKWKQASQVIPVFKRADFTYHSSISKQFEMDLAMDAERMVKDMDKEEIINLAAGFGMPTMGVPIHELRYSLRVMCRQDPKKVMFQKKDRYATIRINITDAIDWGLIDYVPEKMAYFFAQTMTDPIHIVTVGEDPQESLAQFCLSDEGQDAYEKIESLLSFWK